MPEQPNGIELRQPHLEFEVSNRIVKQNIIRPRRIALEREDQEHQRMLLAEAVLRYANGGLDLIYVRRQLVLPITRSRRGNSRPAQFERMIR